VDLQLYARADQAFADDPPLHEAYRARQGRLKTAQELYRLRLDHSVMAARELLDRIGDDAQIAGARERAVAAVRQLDHEHRSELANVHAEFEAEWQPSRRPAVAHHMSAIAELIAASELVLIAGGHVAVLLNRLRLFGLGACCATGRSRLVGRCDVARGSVLLFHDGALHRPGAAELFEAGLELQDGAIVLVRGLAACARRSLEGRLLAGRCAPASCYTLDEGEWLAWRDGARALWAGASTEYERHGRGARVLKPASAPQDLRRPPTTRPRSRCSTTRLPSSTVRSTTARLLASTGFPIVDHGGVTFVYRGEGTMCACGSDSRAAGVAAVRSASRAGTSVLRLELPSTRASSTSSRSIATVAPSGFSIR
jgi:hypothetical protein